MARESGFQLRKYKDGPLDWRLMGQYHTNCRYSSRNVHKKHTLVRYTGSIEVGDRDQCLEQIDSVLEHLSQAPLGSILESNILEKNIAKYFLLSQFAIQYLLFCRKFLEEMVADLRDSNGSAQLEVGTLKRSLSEANNEILQLHKRITQMEAIHEVIFPCHLCTKNFVSNDALNLHISRKHNTNPGQREDRDTPVVAASAKEKENDLTLINTIKLELEIKHLKERLNNAERKIKDGNIEHPAVTSSRSEYSPDKLHKPETISVGIQSNLSEVKEMEDRTEVERTQVCENHLQILSLEEKLIELRQWQEEQKLQNSQFIVEINDKLKELSNAMEMTHSKQQNQKTGEIVLSKSNSMEDLISRKVEEITQTTVDKLNYVFGKIEVEYKNKLEEMESQVSKKPPYQETYGNVETTLAASEHLSPHAVKELGVAPQLPSSDESCPLSNQTFIKTTSEMSETRKSKNTNGIFSEL